MERVEVALGNRAEARIIAEEVSKRRFVDLFAHLDDELSASDLDSLESMLARRLRGEPLQHIVGEWSFRSVQLHVDRRALIPRPETEYVVQIALEELGLLGGGVENPRQRGQQEQVSLVDLGTGSGAIACAVAAELPMARVVAVDRYPDALALAGENRARLAPADASRIELIEGSWYEPLIERSYAPFDCVIANPPYIATSEWFDLDPAVRDFDPREALVSGETGLEDLEIVIMGAPLVLRRGGLLVCEIGATQRVAVLDIAARSQAQRAEVRTDLPGRDRVLLVWF